MPKVSVIIPVYNVEKYLEQCLDSVVAQTLEDIEIVCVDDGSTDSSPAILDDYAARDDRFIVIHQENAHAGIARNNGIAASTGEYLAFLDSDDYFAPEALEKMYNASVEADADLCVCNANRYFEEEGKEYPTNAYLHKNLLPENIPFSGEENLPYILNFTNMCVWNKLFKRSFVDTQHLSFSDRIVGEDRVFVSPALCLAQTITIVYDVLVTHRMEREASLTGEGSVKPLEAYNGWLDLKKELIARDTFPADSFARKAVGAVAYNLQVIKDWDVFVEAVGALQGGIAEELGIVARDEDFYLADWHNDFAKHLNEDSPEQLILFLANLSQSRLRHSGSRSAELSARNKSLRARNERLEIRAEKLTERVDRLKRRIDIQADQIKRLRVMVGKRDFEIEKIKDSRTYQLGKAVMFPARLAKKAVKRIRH